MYAIIQSGGKQYKVEEGMTLDLECLGVEKGSKVDLTDVLLVKAEEKLYTGAPTVTGAKVEATVLENGKGPKVIVFKTKKRKHYRRKNGHRQLFSKVRIEKISVG
ncbi:MAG: 50S ribosomal protein L21 [Acidobacteria bacterium]|nr:50S ribosomal protein L21 [Acidobacteriota bacterium]MBI3657144.1 50S ribosomal protein L21 [Acidobacteriota bacterium]